MNLKKYYRDYVLYNSEWLKDTERMINDNLVDQIHLINELTGENIKIDLVYVNTDILVENFIKINKAPVLPERPYIWNIHGNLNSSFMNYFIKKSSFECEVVTTSTNKRVELSMNEKDNKLALNIVSDYLTDIILKGKSE